MTAKQRLEKFINHKYTDISVAALILLSILLLIMETVWDKAQYKLEHDYVMWANDVILVIFVIELLIRLYTYPRKGRFFRAYFLDIIAVLLPTLRAFRILRVLRLLRLFRMGVLLNRRFFSVSSVFREGVKEYLIVFFIIIMVVLTGAMSLQLLEGHKDSPFESFHETVWWSTLSMISGEPINVTPQTFWGKVITLVLMLGGLTLFAMFTGVVSAVMVQKLKGGMDVRDVELDELKNHIIICGWHRSAALIIEEFQSDKDYRATPIVLIAEFEKQPPLDYSVIDRNLIYIVPGDYTKIEVLKRAGAQKAKIAFILPDKTIGRSDQDRDARSVLAAMIMEKLNTEAGNDIFTCVELLNRDNETHLHMAGVEEIIVSDEYSGNIMAAAAKNYGLVCVLNELFTSKYGNQFYKLEIPPTWYEKTALDMFIWLKKKYNAILMSVESSSNGGVTNALVNPDQDYYFKQGDYIIVISSEKVVLNHDH